MIENTIVEIDKYKQRWNESVTSGEVTNFDPLILPSLYRLNKHPDIATVFSCQGHLDPENGYNDYTGYIMLVHRSYETIHQIFRKTVEYTLANDSARDYVHYWEISNGCMLDLINNGYYIATFIRWGCIESDELHAIFMGILDQATKEVLE